MRPFEITLSVLTVLSGLSAYPIKARSPILILLCAVNLVVLIVHIFVEGPHWQMAPIYLAALLYPALFLFPSPHLRPILAGAMLLLAVASITASTILPMFTLPAPTGPDPIGTQTIHVVNNHPRAAASADLSGKRELMIQLWYPAAPSSNPRAPYRIFAETTLTSSYQAVLWTHARFNPPVANSAAQYPVLLLNPAWNGRRTYYTWLVEDLASRGYIVAAIDHTGNSGPTAFPDGHVSQPDPDPLLDFSTQTFPQLAAYGASQLEVHVDDTRFVLDQLEKWNQDPASPFYRRLDLSRIGALGHSFGGAVSAQAALEDSRILSALDMDGSLWGQVQQTGLQKPFLFIEEDLAHYTPAQLQQDRVAQIDNALDLGDLAMLQHSNATRILLHGSTHSSFTDRSLFSPFSFYSGAGSIPPLREYAILRSYVSAFFDQTLRQIPTQLLDQSPYPEVSIDKFPGH